VPNYFENEPGPRGKRLSPRAVQLGRLPNATYPELKRSKDDSVSFRSMKLQKFRYCCIELCCRLRSPAVLAYGQPSALKRNKSVFLLVGHWTLQA